MNKTACILALDQGTTSSRAMLFDAALNVIAVAQEPLPQLYPQAGWIEHDPEVIWRSQRRAMSEVLERAGCGTEGVAALALANQRETVVVWNRRTGRPIHNAIVWQCRRTAEDCQTLKREGCEPLIRDKTGLVLDAYFSASKIRWILDHTEGARAAARRGELLCGTVDSWLIWKLTGGAAHVTDYTNASRTMLFNIRTLRWDDDLLALFDIPAAMLPVVVASSGFSADCRLDESARRTVPLLGLAGDQQAALFGQGCFEPGQVKNTYGTGCFLLMNTGAECVLSKHGLLTTLTGQTRAGAPAYALEGSVFMGGAVIQWLRDELQLLERAADAGPLAASVPDTGGVYLVPAFTGLGAPQWDMFARGALLGMTRGTGRRQIVRAAEEAIAYQCHDVVTAMEADSGRRLSLLRVDGGASGDEFLMQFQADLLGCGIERPGCLETTALGVAALAALALGWQTQESLAVRPGLKRYTPSLGRAERQRLLAGWRKAVSRAAHWIDDETVQAPPGV